MTLSNESRKSQLFTGSGSTGPFPFTFKVFAKGDLVVTTSVIATGVETTLALDTDYTVLLNKDQDGNPGGSVTLKNGVGEHGPLPTTKRLLISGGMSLTQPQEIGNQDGFFAEDIENALDRAMIAAQQLKVDVDRAFKLPLTSGYTDPDAFISDLLATDQSAQEAQVAAEAAQAAAEVAQVAAEAAQTGAETAQTNAENYVDTISSALSTVYASYVAAIADLGAGDDGTVFRVRDGSVYYVYVYNESADVGILQSIVPVDSLAATSASAASGGTSASGASLPGSPIIDIVGIDALYNHNQIRNRAVTGKPDLNLLGNIKPSKQPLRSSIGVVSTGTPTGTPIVFEYDDSGTVYELLVNNTPTAVGAPYDTQSVQILGLTIPPGRWTLAFRAKSASPIADFDFRCSINGQALATKTALGSGWSTFSISHTFTTEQTNAYVEFCKEASNQTTPSFIYFEDIRLIPGSSATYTEPAERHGWHLKPWTIDSDKLLPNNDSQITDKLHFQVPFVEQRQMEEVTFSLAVKSETNDAAQAANITSPSAQPFSILLTPSEVFASSPSETGGYIGFQGVGSIDTIVQVPEVGLPLNRWSVLTIVFPKEQGLSSDPARIYLNGILLREVQAVIRVKTTARTNDGGKLRFDFSTPHWFTENQPVTVTIANDPVGPVTGVYPGNTELGETYYVRLPAENPQERLYLATEENGTPIDFDGAGAGFVYVQSQRRPVGVVPFTLDMMSVLGFGTIESFGPLGLNFQGDFANVVVYDRALTDAEVSNLVSVQRQRIASHQESASPLGSVLLFEGDSITFGVGTDNSSDTFSFRLFYGLDFNKQEVTSFFTTRNPKTVDSVVSDTNAQEIASAVDADGDLVLVFTNPHFFYTGDKVRLTTDDTLPAGLLTGTDYYIQRVNSTRVKLATTADPAASPIAWDATPGNGTHTVTLEDGRLKLTFASDHNFLDATSTPDAVEILTDDTLPTGLSTSTTYYVRYRDETSLYLTTTDSLTSIPIAYTDTGSGTHTLQWLEDKLGLTFASAHGYNTQDSVQVKTTNTLPDGLDDQEVIYVRKLSDTEMALGFPLPGNVLPAGSTGFGTMTVQKFVPELDPAASKTNNILLATSGSTIQDTLDRKPQLLDSIRRVVAEGSRPIVVYMAGINDLVAGMTPAEMDEKIVELALYWTELREAGAKVIVCTVTSANPAFFVEYSEANKNLFNAKLRLASAHYDALADFADTPQLGTWAAPSAFSYYADDIHPDFRGHIVMSNILSPLIDSFRL